MAKIIIIGGLFAILGCFIKKCPKVAWVSYILLAVYALIVVYHIVIFIYVLTI